jgi:hypothetical protein
MTRRCKFRRGSTIVLVTAIGVIVGILAMAMVQLGYHARMMAVRNVEGIKARAAADAGMVKAIFLMQKKLIDEATWNNDALPSATDTTVEGTGCTFTYTVAGSTGAGWQIDSTGTCVGQSRTTHTRLDISTYWEGIGVENTVDVKLGTSFGVIHGVPADMTIRTNSTATDALKFKAFVTVPGDVLCGPGGDPDTVIDVKATTVISGETYAASEPILFPPVSAPLGTTYVSTPITTTSTLSGGSWQYDTINLGNSQVLTINGPTVLYITGTTTLNNSAEIIVAPGGSLELYLGGNLVNQNSVGFSNETDNSANLKIYGLPGCTEMDLKAKSTLYAAIYTPDAVVNLYNTGDFYGAVTADSFYMKNSGNFYFDMSLMSTTIDDAAAVFTIGRWWEG